MSMYSAICLLSWLTLAALGLMVHNNSRLADDRKHAFYQCYTLLGAAIAAEWGGLLLNGTPDWSIGLHQAIKCADYILTPIAGIYFSLQVTDSKKLPKTIWIILAANTVLALASIFTGWYFYVDYHNVYHHGPLYLVYILMYCVVGVTVAHQFYLYGRGFKRSNKTSLFAIVVIALFSVVAQEVLSVRICYLGLTVCSLLMFIHFTEFWQLENDDKFEKKVQELERDPLTGLYSRYAYTELLKGYENSKTLPAGMVVFSVDINGLKIVNDRFGHLAGDELICGAAQCIFKTMGFYGRCYRTGGDEFICMLQTHKDKVPVLYDRLVAEYKAWKGERDREEMSLSIGWAIGVEHQDCTVEQLISLADDAMYVEKDAYYATAGRERRKR